MATSAGPLAAVAVPTPRQAAAVRTPDASSLFNWAESTYPSLFDTPQLNQTLDVWTYRYYPKTDIYLGVNTSGDVLGLVGKGGGAYDAFPLGKIAAFGCSVYPSDCATATPSGTDAVVNSCNLSGNVLYVPGTILTEKGNVYDADGTSVLMTIDSKTVTKDNATFRGETGLLEISVDQTIFHANVPANGALAGISSPFSSKSYFKIVGNELLNYGFTSGSSTIYYTPAKKLPITPTLNTPYVQSYATSTEGAGVAVPTVNDVETTTFLGVVPLTILAGTYDACKAKIVVNSVTFNATNTGFGWEIAGGPLKGVLLLSTYGSETTKAYRVESTIPPVIGR